MISSLQVPWQSRMERRRTHWTFTSSHCSLSSPLLALPRRQLSQLALIRPAYSGKEQKEEEEKVGPDGKSVTSDQLIMQRSTLINSTLRPLEIRGCGQFRQSLRVTLPTRFRQIFHEMKRYRLFLVVQRYRRQLQSDTNNELPGT